MKHDTGSDALLQLLGLDDPDSLQEQVFLATMLPGMIRLAKVMNRYVELIQERIARLQNGSQPAKRGRPPGVKSASGWPADPEERRKEMQRRQAVARAKRKGHAYKGHSPEGLKKLSEGAKAAWSGLTARQRKAKVKRMVEARRRNKAAREAAA